MNSSKTGLGFGEEQEEAHCSEESFKARIARKTETREKRNVQIQRIPKPISQKQETNQTNSKNPSRKIKLKVKRN